MSAIATVNDPVVRRHVDRWTELVARRIHAHDAGRPVWDLKRFLCELWEEYPDYPPSGAVDLADVFEAAVTAARGNAARFRQALGRRLT
jgi:hypothetical protein